MVHSIACYKDTSASYIDTTPHFLQYSLESSTTAAVVRESIKRRIKRIPMIAAAMLQSIEFNSDMSAILIYILHRYRLLN